jgi:hypothetical protein
MICSRESEGRQMLPGPHTGLPQVACDRVALSDCCGIVENALDSA